MRRIQRESSHDEIIKLLTTGERALFPEIWRLLLFCAALGAQTQTRRPLGKVDSGKAMPETYFSAPGWRGFLYLLSIVETSDSACLRGDGPHQDALITAFEEFANSGLYILAERLQHSSSPIEVVIDLLLHVNGESTEPPDIANLI